MKKIVSLFQRNYNGDRLVRNEVVPGAEWVIAGEGVATRKWDGTCAMIRNGMLYKRYDAKKGKVPPPNFIPSQEPDPNTGHWPGWLGITNKPEDQWFAEASVILKIEDTIGGGLPQEDAPDGTYELVGPKVQGNPEGFGVHTLLRHGYGELPDCPRDFDGLKAWFVGKDIEGVVWHHPDGRMVKIKKKDFGLRRKEPQ